MRNDLVKVAIWGFGAMGSGMAKMILNKKGFEICGICDLNPNYVGKNIFDILDVEQIDHPSVYVSNNIDEVVTEDCDIVLLATDSFTKKAYSKIKLLLEKKVNVISTAEEMAYPMAQNPDLADEMNHIAKENGVTVIGTGINPGMMMDLLVVCLTGVMQDVEKITVKRVNSLSPFGKAVMEEQGVGITVEEFTEGVNNNTMAGHVGFHESVNMIADALKWKIGKFEQQMQPIITEVDRKSPYGFAKAGNVAGVSMTSQGYVDGKLKIDMYHPQQIEPQLSGTNTGDYIEIEGSPVVNMSINPEIDGGIGTIAMCVNMIPHVINARPGLKTMIDLPVPRAIMGDVREMIE